MRTWLKFSALALVGAAIAFSRGHSRADEGMWLFNNPPKKILKEKYGFDATADWMHHLQRSSVRFNSGGSGSFVSSDGLVMTNHHVGADALQKLSTKDSDLRATAASTPGPATRKSAASIWSSTC